MFFEDWEGTNTDVNRSDPHKNTKLEEVSMIVVPNAIIQPRWCIIKYEFKLKYKCEKSICCPTLENIILFRECR